MAEGHVELPDDLVERILILLPLKSLCRFRSVSKQWSSLISSPRFMITVCRDNPWVLVKGDSNHVICRYSDFFLTYSFSSKSWRIISVDFSRRNYGKSVQAVISKKKLAYESRDLSVRHYRGLIDYKRVPSGLRVSKYYRISPDLSVHQNYQGSSAGYLLMEYGTRCVWRGAVCNKKTSYVWDLFRGTVVEVPCLKSASFPTTGIVSVSEGFILVAVGGDISTNDQCAIHTFKNDSWRTEICIPECEPSYYSRLVFWNGLLFCLMERLCGGQECVMVYKLIESSSESPSFVPLPEPKDVSEKTLVKRFWRLVASRSSVLLSALVVEFRDNEACVILGMIVWELQMGEDNLSWREIGRMPVSLYNKFSTALWHISTIQWEGVQDYIFLQQPGTEQDQVVVYDKSGVVEFIFEHQGSPRFIFLLILTLKKIGTPSI
ncbi:hypothetical protein KI387_035889 [Taxus chinensis]|uniref:F-box domain-containing protein n=1 Tax=Taxus chinensis TaxID=29808 RepID=A0AA38FS11_TAXCH|nr:hypothetical protein KI387_035889 [Taxus chinensis]